MNAELIEKALVKVGSANTLVNLISRRVRQLNAGGRPLAGYASDGNGHLGLADIALLEIIDGRMSWEMPELAEWTLPVRKTHKSGRPVVKAPRAS